MNGSVLACPYCAAPIPEQCAACPSCGVQLTVKDGVVVGFAPPVPVQPADVWQTPGTLPGSYALASTGNRTNGPLIITCAVLGVVLLAAGLFAVRDSVVNTPDRLVPAPVAAAPARVADGPNLVTECMDRANLTKAPPKSRADVPDLLVSGRVADIPVPHPSPPTIAGHVWINKPEDYLNAGWMADPERRPDAMASFGFKNGVSVEFTRAYDDYAAIALVFASPANALGYMDVHLADICRHAVPSKRLRGLPGVAFLRDDGVARAVFVLGRTEINLSICTCIEVHDRVALAARWAHRIVRQLEGTDRYGRRH